MSDCPRCGSVSEEHAVYYCKRVSLFWNHVGEWTARIEHKQLGLLNVGYVVDNVLPLFRGEKRVIILAVLAVVRMVFGRRERRDCMTMQTFLILS